MINVMQPYPKKELNNQKCTFNYRLSRARRVIENVFGILCAKWRIFRKPIIAKVENAENYVKAAVCLHNILRLKEDTNKSINSNSTPNFGETAFQELLDPTAVTDESLSAQYI